MNIQGIAKLMSSNNSEDTLIAWELMKTNRVLMTEYLIFIALVGEVSYREESRFKKITGYELDEIYMPGYSSGDNDYLLEKIEEMWNKN